MTPVRIGIIGMGGFAGAHHQAVTELERRGEARLVCTCDPQLAIFASQQEKWSFARRCVRVFDDYRRMLEQCHRDIDLLVVPTPIPLHAEMHRAGNELGLAVYLEKPPTLDYTELEQMIARDRGAKFSALVGFNFIIEEARQTLKRRLLAGEFGPLKETRLDAQWPRPTSYYQRNNWAGQLLSADGRLVLDSCFGNAASHYVHNMLFWAGDSGQASWAQIDSVEAELYRAHAIAGADTFFVEAKSPHGVTMRFALSHACAGAAHQTEIVVCERATLRYVTGKILEVQWKDGRVERVVPETFDPLIQNHLEYYRYLRGESSRPATTLADARPFVMLNDLAYISSQVIPTLSQPIVTQVRNEKEQMDYLEIAGLGQAQEEFLAKGIWPSSRGWAQESARRRVTPESLPQLYALVRAMAEKRG